MPGWLAESLGISLAAQAATLPDVLATFGRLSLVSPAVNLAVVPLVPAAMLAGEQHHARHHGRPHDRRRRPGRDDVRDDRPEDGERDDSPGGRGAAPRRAATIAMFQPEMATTWLTPAVAKSAASVRSTRSRSPMRMPAASPASGSGNDRRSASPAASRATWRPRGGASSSRSSRASRLPDAPVRRR